MQIESASSASSALDLARAKLKAPVRPDRSLLAVVAAALFAVSALTFAAVAILAPPLVVEPMAKPGVR